MRCYTLVGQPIHHAEKVTTNNEPNAASSTLNTTAATATAALCFLSPSGHRHSEDAKMVAEIMQVDNNPVRLEPSVIAVQNSRYKHY